MIHDDLTELLRELVAATGAAAAAIVRGGAGGDPAQAARARRRVEGGESEVIAVPLGGGTLLEVRFDAAGPAPGGPDAAEPVAGDNRQRDEPPPSQSAAPVDRRAAIERSARAVRACARRWEIGPDALPELSVPGDAPPRSERVLERIVEFLAAFAGAHGAANAVVTLRGAPIASATPLSELERARLPFLLRQVTAEAERSAGTSHGEIAGDDVYATSFWFGACLVAFFSRPYAEDFVRHRARLVTRELALLLPLLDEPPPTPAGVAPIPE